MRYTTYNDKELPWKMTESCMYEEHEHAHYITTLDCIAINVETVKIYGKLG